MNCVRTPYNEESLAVDIIMPRRSVVATEQAESGIPGEQPSTALKLNPRVFIVKTLIFGLAVSSFFTYYYYTSGSFRLVEGAYDRVYQEQRQNEQVQTNVRGEQTQRHHPDSTNNNEDPDVKEGFIVWSQSCKIPNISAHHQSISKFVYRKKRIKCSSKPALTEISFDPMNGTYSISVVPKYIPVYLYSKHQIYRPKCCYSLISRKPVTENIKGYIDDQLETSRSTCFEKSTELPKYAEFIYVNCHSIRKSNGYRVSKNDFYKDMFALLVIRDDTKKKLINRTLVSQYYHRLSSSRIARLNPADDDGMVDQYPTDKLIISDDPPFNDDDNNDASALISPIDDTIKKKFVASSIATDTASRLDSGTLEMLKKLPDNFNVERRLSPSRSKTGKPNSIMPSVLMIGIDSVSRLNLIRSMPKTMKFLREYDWLTLEGYTKVAENTFPNLIPILTGLSDQQLRKTCYPSQNKEIDRCPFVWKDFERRGYVTAYVEDEPKIGTFNYNKYGFARSPTDYYLRPFMLAAEQKLQVKKFSGLNFCLGPRAAADYMFDYCRDFVGTYRDVPYFALFWMNSFSHNDANDVSSMDDDVDRFFRSIMPYLDDTIVIFLSDHGMRWGSIRQTFVGWVEERMPFVYFWLPDSFKRDHPYKYRNLMRNKNRLTSPFDLHVTIKDILYNDDQDDAAAVNSERFVNATGCPECRSLFEEASNDRTCARAGIPYRWCTCESDYDPVSHNDRAVTAAANFIVRKINEILNDANTNNSSKLLQPGTECVPLELNRITSVRQKVKNKSRKDHAEYILIIETKPNHAIYETTVRHNGPIFEIIGYVERINTYGQQSYCSSDLTVKRYCLCVASSKSKKQARKKSSSPLRYAVFV